MASNSEIVAILSAGISFKRVLVPYLIAATLLASISLYLNHWLLPKANESRIAFEDTYLRYKFRNHNKNIHKQIPAARGLTPKSNPKAVATPFPPLKFAKIGKT